MGRCSRYGLVEKRHLILLAPSLENHDRPVGQSSPTLDCPPPSSQYPGQSNELTLGLNCQDPFNCITSHNARPGQC